MNILIVLTVFLSLFSLIYASCCHAGQEKYISKYQYTSLLRAYPRIVTNPQRTLWSFGTSCILLDSIRRFAMRNIDEGLKTSIINAIDAYENSEDTNTKVRVYLCSCAKLLDEGVYCTTDECDPSGCNCRGQCIGSSDYYSGMSCDMDNAVKSTIAYYNNVTNILRYRHIISSDRLKRDTDDDVDTEDAVDEYYRGNSQRSNKKKPSRTVSICAQQNGKIIQENLNAPFDRFDDNCKKWCPGGVSKCGCYEVKSGPYAGQRHCRKR